MSQELRQIGERLRAYRLERKMTQQELAERSDLSLPFVNQIENNYRNISLDSLIKLLDALEVSLSDFFLPFSDHLDDRSFRLLVEIQSSPHKERLLDAFLELSQMINEP